MNELPYEIITNILGYLKADDLLKIRLLNKYWHQCAMDPIIWYNYCFNEYEINTGKQTLQYYNNWWFNYYWSCRLNSIVYVINDDDKGDIMIYYSLSTLIKNLFVTIIKKHQYNEEFIEKFKLKYSNVDEIDILLDSIKISFLKRYVDYEQLLKSKLGQIYVREFYDYLDDTIHTEYKKGDTLFDYAIELRYSYEVVMADDNIVVEKRIGNAIYFIYTRNIISFPNKKKFDPYELLMDTFIYKSRYIH